LLGSLRPGSDIGAGAAVDDRSSLNNYADHVLHFEAAARSGTTLNCRGRHSREVGIGIKLRPLQEGLYGHYRLPLPPLQSLRSLRVGLDFGCKFCLGSEAEGPGEQVDTGVP